MSATVQILTRCKAFLTLPEGESGSGRLLYLALMGALAIAIKDLSGRFTVPSHGQMIELLSQAVRTLPVTDEKVTIDVLAQRVVDHAMATLLKSGKPT